MLGERKRERNLIWEEKTTKTVARIDERTNEKETPLTGAAGNMCAGSQVEIPIQPRHEPACAAIKAVHCSDAALATDSLSLQASKATLKRLSLRSQTKRPGDSVTTHLRPFTYARQLSSTRRRRRRRRHSQLKDGCRILIRKSAADSVQSERMRRPQPTDFFMCSSSLHPSSAAAALAAFNFCQV